MSTLSTLVEPTAIGANDQDLPPGTEVGEYRIERVLGKGGFGTVYGAVQPVIGKQVAIKVLARKYSADEEIVSRFVAEARAVNQIRHRNIIDIFSFGSLADGRHYYVAEHLEGEPLDVHLRERGPFPLDEAIPILRAIAKALDAAHAKGIAHRDLKPENIFLARDADGAVFPKLLDFGIAKLLAPDDDVRHKTNTGVPIGTPYYMSPEQCRGKNVDHRTDIYSFGIVVYRMLTGALPFQGDDYMELLLQQMNDEPPSPSSLLPTLPPTVDQAIAWMMRKDRTKRPATVLEGVSALDATAAVTAPRPPARAGRPTLNPRLSTHDALAATITPAFVKPEPPASRTPLIIGAVVLAVGAAIAGFIAVRSGSSSGSTPVPASDVVQPAPVTPPPAVPVVQPAAPPVVEPVVTAAPPAPSVPAPSVPAKTSTAPKPRKGTPAAAPAAPTTTAPTETKDRSHDTIELGSDAFK